MDNKMSDILVVGSANIDLVMMPERLPQPGETLLGARFASVPGGKGANQAVAAARAGGKVGFIGCVGDDAYGDQLAHGLRQEGIDLSGLSRVAGPSGVACVITADGDTNMIVVASGANALLDAQRIDEGAFRDARIVLAQLETPMPSVLHTAKLAQRHGATFILDPAPAQPLSHDLLSLTDWLTPNEGEALALAGGDATSDDPLAIAMLLRQQGARGIVLKLGARGALAAGARRAQPPPRL
jgi:ribokinase